MTSESTSPQRTGLQAGLCLGALGVVFGDIGTSPLYTINQCLAHLPEGISRTEGLLGVLSLIFWSLMLIVSVKYLTYVTRADNRGEGGIFALLALLQPVRDLKTRRGVGPVVFMILCGAALLYGDGIITPAISVLGAAEGFAAVSPHFTTGWIVLIACVILGGLFWIQHKGTHRIGGVFGPVMLIWFVVLGLLGLWHIVKAPEVFRALNPLLGFALFRQSPIEIAALLGAVVLAITGAEALYADMGHFGRTHIMRAWYFVALPGLALNYFGQGAFILSHPTFDENPFFALAPQGFGRIALTGLSIAAAIIASQALISGAFSLTRQAIQLGYFPRLKITHTNAAHAGQIYVPFVNALLAMGSIFTVAGFRTTENLAAAYGIAVTGTMGITTVAYFLVTRKVWHRSLWLAVPTCGVFLLVDLAFFGANAHKLADGGWFPLAIGGIVLAIMHSWKLGRDAVFRLVYSHSLTEAELITIARSHHVTRVKGAAVFMAGSPNGTPVALLHHVKANRCLHETIVLLSVMTDEVPTVPDAERLTLREVGEGIWRAIGRYGYMESPDVSELMERIRAQNVPINPQSTVYFFNREMIITGGDAPMWEWSKSLYGVLSRNARSAKDYYQIPPTQIIELGLPVHL